MQTVKRPNKQVMLSGATVEARLRQAGNVTRHYALQATTKADADVCAGKIMRSWGYTAAQAFKALENAGTSRNWHRKTGTKQSFVLVLEALARRAR